MEKIDIKSLFLYELEEQIINLGEKSFRAAQIFLWLHKKRVACFDEMSNIPAGFRNILSEKYIIPSSKIVKKLESTLDNTTKYLFEIPNNIIIESVLMKYSYGNSVCISSQAGCRMGCTFCASACGGLERNLNPSEMLEQVYQIHKDAGGLNHIVIMGSGEPLDNYDNTVRFIRLVNSKDGLNISQRHITISTCGLIPQIYKLADEGFQITLAVSLHASNDLVRQSLMPIAKKMSMNDIFNACRYYSSKTKRRITYEYALIKGINDSMDMARELTEKIKGTLAHVNLIPINDVKEIGYKRSEKEVIEKFAKILSGSGIETTIRRGLGNDIDSACGQLRKRYMGYEDDSPVHNLGV